MNIFEKVGLDDDIRDLQATVGEKADKVESWLKRRRSNIKFVVKKFTPAAVIIAVAGFLIGVAVTSLISAL